MVVALRTAEQPVRRGAAPTSDSPARSDGFGRSRVAVYRAGRPVRRRNRATERSWYRTDRAAYVGSELSVPRGSASAFAGREPSLPRAKQRPARAYLDWTDGHGRSAPVRDRSRVLRLEDARRDRFRRGLRRAVRHPNRRQHRGAVRRRVHRVRGIAVRFTVGGRHGPYAVRGRRRDRQGHPDGPGS